MFAKAGKEAGIDVDVEAISETELEDYVDGKDVVLIGPHLKYFGRQSCRNYLMSTMSI